MGHIPLRPDQIMVPTLARMLGVSHQVIYRAARHGTGPRLTAFGRQHVVMIADAIAWVQDRLDSPSLLRAPGAEQRHRDALRSLKVRQVVAAIKMRSPVPQVSEPEPGRPSIPSTNMGHMAPRTTKDMQAAQRARMADHSKYTPQRDGLML